MRTSPSYQWNPRPDANRVTNNFYVRPAPPASAIATYVSPSPLPAFPGTADRSADLGQAIALSNLGPVYSQLGRHGAALRIASKTGDRDEVARAYAGMAQIGDFDRVN